MKSRRLLLTLLIAGMLIPVLGFAADKLTYEEYQAQLEDYQQREQLAKQRIDELTAETAELQTELDAMDLQSGQVWQQIYAYMEIAPKDLRKFADELDAIGKELESYEGMEPEAAYQKRGNLVKIEKRLKEIAKDRPAVLSRYKEIIQDLYARMASVEVRVPDEKGTKAGTKEKYYTVIRGDHLWKIAAKREHYNDGMKWMRIYSVNHDQIRDPDLIFPKQVFSIPMDIGAGQFLVKPGQNLSSIAESIYNDPFQWRKLYEANRGLVDDPTKIYPEMILTVPGR